MDAATIHSKIYQGRAKAALRIGLPCAIHRPSGGDPLSSVVATTNVAFNARDPKYRKPSLYTDPVWYGDFDGRLSREGDYIVRAFDGETWFIAAQQQLLPIALVGCNRSIRLLRQPLTMACGIVGYGGLVNPVSALPVPPSLTLDSGMTLDSSVALNSASLTLDSTAVTLDATGATLDGGRLWPASILIGGRTQSGNGLPADVKEAGWKILLPPSFPITVSSGDILIDDLSRRYAVESAEQSDLGWRLIATEVHT